MTAELGHNSGLIDPDIAAEAMRRSLAPWQDRRAEFERKAAASKVASQDDARAAIDFVRMARALVTKAELLRDDVQGPYEIAAASAGGIARDFIEKVEAAIATVEGNLKAYNEERRRRAQAREAEQAAAEAALAAAADDRGAPPVQIPAKPPGGKKKRKVAPVRSDLGGLMVETDKWTVEVEDVSLVPLMVLKSARVMEAIRIVARDFMKNDVEVAGCRKVFGITTVIR